MTNRLKQYEVLKRASLFLQQNKCESQVAEILLRHFLQVSRAQFYANMQEVVAPEITERFWEAINRHVTTRIPVQHLTGYEYFYGRKFHVNEHVLIPRPETEQLVEHVINKVHKTPLSIVDLGTGSGVIAITLALELKRAKVYATDISEEALHVAKKNAHKHCADVRFMLGDFATPLIEKNIMTQIIVSNPPYIAYDEKDTLSQTVKYDPELALFAANDGLAAYNKIIEQSKKIIAKNGILAFEIGYQQGEAVQKLIKKSYPHSSVKVYQDINGHDRIVIAHINV
ncbi:MAG TPA: peptide chain release factor N(5)-glutamine methyltransferase [Bacillota bacterium]|nr:peptide chain release factor N(5)-glutamine methyltransferase [Bacillota bacterium]